MSDIQEEQKRLYKRAEENDIKLLKEENEMLKLEIERLKNIIDTFEEELERELNIKEEQVKLEHNTFIDINNTLKTVLRRFKEIKGDNK